MMLFYWAQTYHSRYVKINKLTNNYFKYCSDNVEHYDLNGVITVITKTINQGDPTFKNKDFFAHL